MIGSVGPSGDQRLCHFDRRHVDNERAGCRTTFYGVDAGYGFGVQRIGAKTVDRFSGECDQSAGAEQAGGMFDLRGTDEWERVEHRSF